MLTLIVALGALYIIGFIGATLWLLKDLDKTKIGRKPSWIIGALFSGGIVYPYYLYKTKNIKSAITASIFSLILVSVLLGFLLFSIAYVMFITDTIPYKQIIALPEPIKVEYRITNEAFLRNKCKQKTFFNQYALYIPAGLALKKQVEVCKVKIDHYQNKDGDLAILFSEREPPETKLVLFWYNIPNVYELNKKMYYNRLPRASDIIIPAKHLVQIKDISAKDWHGFAEVHYNRERKCYLYRYLISDYRNKKTAEVAFSVSNNSLSQNQRENIMASFRFLD